jgi:photosystem II stability/assembly factor-like uncharacterized protein
MLHKKYVFVIIIIVAGDLLAQQGWFSVSAGYEYTHSDCSFIDADTGWVAKETYGVLKTVNGGKEWEDQDFGNWYKPLDLQFIDNNTGWMSADGKRLYKTTDGGENWELLMENTSPDYSSSVLSSVCFIDTNVGYCAGYQYNKTNFQYESILMKSQNGGKDWTPQTAGSNDFRIFSLFFINQQTGWLSGESGKIFKTENGGTSWAEKDSKTASSLYCIFFIDAQKGWATGGEGVILASADGGEIWTPQTSPTSETLWGLHFLNENVGYACGPNGTILKTLEGGLDWHLQVSGTTAGLSDIVFFSADTGYCVGSEGTILKTVNGGVGTNSVPEDKRIMPKNTILHQNYPNPFNPKTIIKYDLIITSDVDLSIFNLRGQKVATLVSERQAAGIHASEWDISGRPSMASGIYYYRLQTGEFTETKKMILVQ